MARKITDQKCFNHADREAAARCPECGRYFCRECVTEHEGRVLCAVCLARVAAGSGREKPRMALIARALQLTAAIVLLWLFFYTLGLGLLSLPTSFHQGTIWPEETFPK